MRVSTEHVYEWEPQDDPALLAERDGSVTLRLSAGEGPERHGLCIAFRPEHLEVILCIAHRLQAAKLARPAKRTP